tara:strand:+ start:465 stop:764 length:300 start_codon:yes stop_codon:yes gene_type:complete
VIYPGSNVPFRVMGVTGPSADCFIDRCGATVSLSNCLKNNVFMRAVACLRQLRSKPRFAQPKRLWHGHYDVSMTMLKAIVANPVIAVMRHPFAGALEGV